MFTVIKNGTVLDPQGFTGSTAACGIKKENQLDLSLVYSKNPCSCAAVFTKNQVVAAPVTLDRETLGQNRAQMHGVLTNAGNANAATGPQGLDNARSMQQQTAEQTGKAPQQFMVLSTGVIGVQLPMEKIEQGITAVTANLSSDVGGEIAKAICTTDTFPKSVAIELQLSSGTVKIGGMSKGAGMIHPDMATMLAVVTTDAAVDPDLLHQLWQAAADVSFNRISVDGDTSTNDTAICLANGASGVTIPTSGDDLEKFQTALNWVSAQLAQMIVRDGEGATKFIEIRVGGTRTKEEAHTIANTVAISPLVKTAFAGSDANWGRIMMAAGRSGVPFDQFGTTLNISNSGESWLTLLANGLPTDYREEDAAAIFAEKDIIVDLILSEGDASDIVWTCDLTHGYVSINADYRS